MRERRKGATRNAALTVLPTMFNGKIMRVRSKRDSSRKFLQAPAVPMAIRLAIQWMLPPETYDVDAPVAISTSAISIPNDNDFLISLFIIHYAWPHSKTMSRNIKLNFMFYHIGFFQGNIVKNILCFRL